MDNPATKTEKVFGVRVVQHLAKDILVKGVKTQEEAEALVQQYDQQVGVDADDIVDVTYEPIPVPDDKYPMIITPDDIEEEDK